MAPFIFVLVCHKPPLLPFLLSAPFVSDQFFSKSLISILSVVQSALSTLEISLTSSIPTPVKKEFDAIHDSLRNISTKVDQIQISPNEVSPLAFSPLSPSPPSSYPSTLIIYLRSSSCTFLISSVLIASTFSTSLCILQSHSSVSTLLKNFSLQY